MSEKKTPLILHIDDEDAIRLSVQGFLEDCDYEVITAENGKTGLQKFEELNPDLILVDLRMPVVDGLDVLAHVQKKTPDIPIIVISGTGVIADVIDALRLGAWDYILKPITSMSVLQHAVERALERARLIKENKLYQEHLEELVAKRTGELVASNKRLSKEIVAHKMTEEALKESRNRLDSILKTIPDIVYRLDKNGYITFINESVNRYGYQSKDVIGKHILDFVHPDDRAKAKFHLNERRTRDRKTKRLEIRVFNAQKEELDMEFSYQPFFENNIFLVEAEGIYESGEPSSLTFVGTQGIARDITERKKAELALKESEERLKLTLRGADLGLWDWDIQSDQIYYNDRSIEMLEYKRDEIANLSPFRKHLVHPDDTAKLNKQLDNHFSGKSAFYECEIRMKTKGGEWKWILDRGMIVSRDENGNPLRMSGTHLDISARKNFELEKEQLQKELHQSQKMESIGTLAGGVAHDFNNLLTVINGHAELALQNDDITSIKTGLDSILESGQRAIDLTRQLLAFSRKQVISPKILNLNESIGNIEKMLRRLIGENITIRTELNKNIHNIKADSGQMEQVIMNLVINARDAINEKKKSPVKEITIKTNNNVIGSEFEMHHPGCKKGKYVILEIHDTGIGMDDDTLNKIFDPFFTTKSVERGTGLGLSTVYGIVSQNNGCIDVKSDPGVGSTFTVYWPATELSHAETDSEKKEIDNLYGEESILLVEDDEMVRNLTYTALQEHGYRVHVVANGDQAVNLLEEEELKMDLLITDVIMPGMSGKELYDLMMKKTGKFKVLFISGYPDEHLFRDGILNKELNFLSKPFAINELLEKVKEILVK